MLHRFKGVQILKRQIHFDLSVMRDLKARIELKPDPLTDSFVQKLDPSSMSPSL